MILYNVTISVDNSIKEDWLQWIKQTHIPEIMATGLFTEYKLLTLLFEQNQDSQTFAVQYFCKSLKDFQLYEGKFAPILRQKTQERYGEKCLAFRTLLEVLE